MPVCSCVLIFGSLVFFEFNVIVKPKFHRSSFLVADVTRMSLTCHGEIGCVGRRCSTCQDGLPYH